MLTPEAEGVGGMLVVSLRVFRAKRQYFMCACIGYDDHVFISLKPAHCMSYLCVFKRSPSGVKICLSHAQIGLLYGSQKARATPRWSPLEVKLKIHMRVPPTGRSTSTGALQTTYPGQKRADKRTFNRQILLIIERSKPTNGDDRLHTSIPANTIN